MKTRLIAILTAIAVSASLAATGGDNAGQGGKAAEKPAKLSPEQKRLEDAKAKLKALLGELKSFKLKAWPAPSRQRDLAKEQGLYRVKGSDGAFKYLNEIEGGNHPEFVEICLRTYTGVFERQQDGSFLKLDRWEPVYWNEKSKNWTTIPPALMEFQEAEGKASLARTYLGFFCSSSELQEADSSLSLLTGASSLIKPEDRDAMKAKLSEAARKAGAKSGIGEQFERIFALSAEIYAEQDPAKKIELFAKRLPFIESALAQLMKK